MAENIENLDKICAIAKGSTWGTAVNASVAYDGKFKWTASQTQSQGVGVNQHFYRNCRRTDLSVSGNFNGQVTYEGACWNLIAGVLRGGTDTPAEQNASEGDYLHTITMGTGASPFYTVAWMIDDTNAIEIPSLQIQDFTLSGSVGNNEPLMFDINGVGDRYVIGGENTWAELSTVGGSPQNFEMAVLGCAGTPANHYFRMNSDSGALDSGDDLPIKNFSIQLSRNETAQRTTRGANSYYILQPRETGRVTGQLSITLNYEYMSNLAPLSDFLASVTEDAKSFKAELFVDGTQIGSGDNRSIKFELPYLCYAGERPTEYERDETIVSNPVLNFMIMGTPDESTPTGMTADVPSLLLTNEVSTGY